MHKWCQSLTGNLLLDLADPATGHLVLPDPVPVHIQILNPLA
jgi:hypothetical protein